MPKLPSTESFEGLQMRVEGQVEQCQARSECGGDILSQAQNNRGKSIPWNDRPERNVLGVGLWSPGWHGGEMISPQTLLIWKRGCR